MTRLTLRVLGIPLVTFDLESYEIVEEEESPAVGGGSAHDFTIATPFVDERYLPWEDDCKSFGFKR